MTKGKKTSNDPQNIALKTKDLAPQTPFKTTAAPERYAVPAPHVTLVKLLVYKQIVLWDYYSHFWETVQCMNVGDQYCCKGHTDLILKMIYTYYIKH
jgi:hypothetical protein